MDCSRFSQHRCIATVLVAAGLFAVSSRVAVADEMSASDVFKAASPSVVHLDVTTQDGKEYYGTGFMAIKDGVAVTAYHVIRNAKTVTATFSDGQEFDSSGYIDGDAKRDIALIRIKVFGRHLLTLAPEAPDIGGKAYAIGNPEGLDFTISDGIVSQIRQVNGVNIYQLTTPISAGNSGGPILDGKGNVIGLVSFQLEDGQNLNFAMPSTYVLGLDSTLQTQPFDQVKYEPEDVNPTSTPSASSDNSTPSPSTPNSLTASAPASNVQPSSAPASTPPAPSGSASDTMAAGNSTTDKSVTYTSNDVLDAQLANAYETFSDGQTALYYCDYEMLHKNGYGTGPGQMAYSELTAVKTCLAELQTVNSQDAVRKRVLTNLIGMLTSLQEAFADYINAVSTAETNSNWGHDSDDLLNKSSSALVGMGIIAPSDLSVLLGSAAFTNSQPLLAKYMSENTIDLGYSYQFSDSLYVMGITSKGIADQMGLEVDDDISNINDLTVADVFALTDVIQANQGKRVKITVVRDGKSKSWKTTVPTLPTSSK